MWLLDGVPSEPFTLFSFVRSSRSIADQQYIATPTIQVLITLRAGELNAITMAEA